jgi:hypothetical protein
LKFWLGEKSRSIVKMSKTVAWMLAVSALRRFQEILLVKETERRSQRVLEVVAWEALLNAINGLITFVPDTEDQ